MKPYLYGETIELGGGGKKEKKKTSDPVLSALLVAKRC